MNDSVLKGDARQLRGYLLICKHLLDGIRLSRGVGADERLARSCSSLMAHLDPANGRAPGPARALQFKLVHTRACVEKGQPLVV